MIVRRQSVSSGYSSRLSSHWPEVRCLAGISMRLVRVMTNTERVKYQSVMYQKYSLSNQEDIRLAKSRPKTTTRLSQTLHMVSLFCQPIQRIQSKTDRLNASGQRPTVSETQPEDQERTRASIVATPLHLSWSLNLHLHRNLEEKKIAPPYWNIIKLRTTKSWNHHDRMV